MIEVLKWILVVILTFVCSTTVTFGVFWYFGSKIEDNSSCGTGSLGYVIILYAAVGILFGILCGGFGVLFAGLIL